MSSVHCVHIPTVIYYTEVLQNMSQKTVTVAVAGCGSRGNSYAACCRELGDRVKIVACADIRPEKLSRFADEYGIPAEGR